MPPRKKKSGDQADQTDRHKKRIGVNVPEEWHAVMRKLAGKKKMPVLWYLLDLTKREAEAEGIDTPTPPWEGEDEKTEQ